MRSASASLVLGVVLLGGCGSGGAKSPDAGPRAARSPERAPAFNLRDPIAVSQLRERAIGIIEQTAKSEDAQVRANAVEAAGFAPERFREVIAKGLDDPHWAVRSVALMEVGKAQIKPLAPRARTLLSDASAHTRASAIYALTRLGENPDQTPLATTLLKDPNLGNRSHAAFVLGEIGNPSALSLLRDAARDPLRSISNATARLFYLQCAEAMIKLGDTGQFSVLRAALYPSSPEELEATALAVQVIGEVKDRQAIDQLVYLTANKDPMGRLMPAEIRIGAAGALARMGLRRGDFIADEYIDNERAALRAQAAFVYGDIGGPDAWAQLSGVLDDPDPAVRVAAATAVLKLAMRPPGADAPAP